MTPSQLRWDEYAIILNSAGAVLLLDGALPFTTTTTEHFWQTVEPFNAVMRALTRLNVTTLRMLHSHYGDNIITRVYLMECHDESADATWISRDQISTATNVPSVLPDALREWDKPNSVEWYAPQWYAQIAAELPTRLHALGHNITAVEQVRTWERSSVLRLLTDSGSLYFKIVPPHFAHEPRLTQWLGEHFSADCPAVLHIVGNQMMMPDYGGVQLNKIQDVDVWVKAMQAHARLQIALSAHVDELTALGVPDRRLEWMDAGIDALFADDAALRGGGTPLSDDEITTLRTLVPHLHDACAKMRDYHIPYTLEHGDFWTGQIIVCDEQILFTDWSDSAISNPLYALVFFLAEIDNELPNVPDARQRLRDAYLSCWTAHEPMTRLLEAYELAKILSPLHTSIFYHSYVLPRMAVRWEMEGMLAYNLRLLLKATENLTLPIK